MKSKYNKVIGYDLETGGFDKDRCSITEVAVVSFDIHSLDIESERSWLIRPYINMTNVNEDEYKEARAIFKALSLPNAETKVKELFYKGEYLSIRNLEQLEVDIVDFKLFLATKTKEKIINTDLIKELLKSDHKDVFELFFNVAYTPQALEITKITKEMLFGAEFDYKEAFVEINATIVENKVGNSLPILAGHNIKKFDNPFFEIYFSINGVDLLKIINTFVEDTLELAHKTWSEMASYNLGTCCNKVGLTLKEAHRALPDTISNVKMLIKIYKSSRGEGSQASSYVRKKYDFNY